MNQTGFRSQLARRVPVGQSVRRVGRVREIIVCPDRAVERKARRRAARKGEPLLLCYTPQDPASFPGLDLRCLPDEVRPRHPTTEYRARARRIWDRLCDVSVGGVPIREKLSADGIDLLFAAEAAAVGSLTHFFEHLDLASQYVAAKGPESLVLIYAPSEATHAWLTAAQQHGLACSVAEKPRPAFDKILLNLGSHFAEARPSRLHVLHVLSRPVAMLWPVLTSRLFPMPKTSARRVWIEVPNAKMSANQLPIAQELTDSGVPVGFLLTGRCTVSEPWARRCPAVSLAQLSTVPGCLRSLITLCQASRRFGEALRAPSLQRAVVRSVREYTGVVNFILQQAVFGVLPGYVFGHQTAVNAFRRLNLERLVVHDERPALQRALIAGAHHIGVKVVAVQFGQIFRHGGMGSTPVDKLLACGPYHQDPFHNPQRPGAVEPIGFVATDALYCLLAERQQVRARSLSRLGMRCERPVILLALSPLTGPGAPSQLSEILRTVAGVVAQLSCVLLVKLHPAEWQAGVYETVLSGCPGLRYSVTRSELSPQEAVVCGDVHITNGSTIGVDMLLTNRPMIDLPYNGHYYPDGYANAGAALRADTPHGLKDVLTAAIESPAEISVALRADREAFILERLTRFDGKRAAAAADAILRFYGDPQFDSSRGPAPCEY